MLSQATTPEVMDMEVMVATDVATTERGRLMLKLRLTLNQDTTPEVMDMEVMVAMDVATTERGRLMLNQDTPEAMVMVVMDMEVMDVDTMARGKLAMAVHMEVMVDMDIAVKFVLLFIISPPPIFDIFIGYGRSYGGYGGYGYRG